MSEYGSLEWMGKELPSIEKTIIQKVLDFDKWDTAPFVVTIARKHRAFFLINGFELVMIQEESEIKLYNHIKWENGSSTKEIPFDEKTKQVIINRLIQDPKVRLKWLFK